MTAHVFLLGETWDDIRPGDVREVWAKLERAGSVEIVDPATPAALTPLEGSDFAIVGTVSERDGEDLKVDSILRMDVDLELSPHVNEPIPDVAVGDRIRVVGTIEIDFDPDDHETG